MAARQSLPAKMVGLKKLRAEPGLDFCEGLPLPTVGPRDVLVKVKKAGICGTDHGIYEWGPWARSRIKPGIIIGHEVMGTVVAVGEAADDSVIGKRVSVEGHITCGACQPCRTGNGHVCDKVLIIGIDRDGTFTEYLSIPESNLWPLHPDIPDRFGAIMDPFGNAVHTVMTAGVSGKSVLLTGVGIIGLMAVCVARAAGAAQVIAADIDEHRLDLARDLGADACVCTSNPQWQDEVRKLTGGLGPEIVCEMSGATQAIQGGLAVLRNCGTMAVLGLPKGDVPINFNDHIIFKACRIVGVSGRRMFETWYQAEDLLVSRRVDLDPIITHEIPLRDFEQGFKLMTAKEAIKVILNVEGTK